MLGKYALGATMWAGAGSSMVKGGFEKGIGALGKYGLGARMWAGAGSSMAKGAWANPYARSAIGGAALGGMYGAMSDNTSVLGGALGGAALGAGGLFAGRFAQNMGMKYGLNLKNAATNIGQLGYYKGKGALGYGLNKGKSVVASVQAKMSGATIGNTAVASNQPINKVASSMGKQMDLNLGGGNQGLNMGKRMRQYARNRRALGGIGIPRGSQLDLLESGLTGGGRSSIRKRPVITNPSRLLSPQGYAAPQGPVRQFIQSPGMLNPFNPRIGKF